MTGPQQAASPSRWERVKEIFEKACELQRGELTRYLDETCGGDPALREEVVSLLEAYQGAGEFLEEAAVQLSLPRDSAGRRIGPYKLESLLGQGAWARSIFPRARWMDMRCLSP